MGRCWQATLVRYLPKFSLDSVIVTSRLSGSLGFVELGLESLLLSAVVLLQLFGLPMCARMIGLLILNSV